MKAALFPVLMTIIFFAIRGAISLFLIIWGTKRIKKYFNKKKAKNESSIDII